MGVYADCLAQGSTFKSSDQIAAFLQSRINSQVDPATTQGAVDAVHTIATYADTVSAGTFTLTITLANGETFTTAAIAFDADDATIESAIDTAATSAAITGWSNGDITVVGSDTDLTDGTITLTFDGDSVSGTQHPTVSTLNGVGLFIAGAGATEEVAGNTTDTAEVQNITQFANNPTGGTFTLTFSLSGDGPVTIAFSVTAAFDITAAALETAIDAAAVAAGYATWSGEIAVVAENTDLTDGYLELTYGDGLLVEFANHTLVTVDGSNLTGGLLEDPPIAITTPGQSARAAWGALYAMGVLTGAIPNQDAAADGNGITLGPNAGRVPGWVVRELAREAAAEDNNNDTYYTIVSGMGYQDKAPLAQRLGTSSIV